MSNGNARPETNIRGNVISSKLVSLFELGDGWPGLMVMRDSMTFAMVCSRREDPSIDDCQGVVFVLLHPDKAQKWAEYFDFVSQRNGILR
jgi:hypothetical protein